MLRNTSLAVGVKYTGKVRDVYAVGATALCLLTGCEPESLPHKGLAIDVPRALGGQVDRRLVHALGLMLEPDPDRRAGSVQAALLEAGLRVNDDTPQTSTGQARRGQAKDWEREAEHAERKAEREAEHAERKAEREAEHAERRYSGRSTRPRSPIPRGVLFGIAILIALRVAGVVTYATFRVVLPLLFGVLAVFLGRHLYRKAQRMQDIGRAGEDGLNRAAAHIREQFLSEDAPPEPARPKRRADSGPGAPPRIRVDDDSASPADPRQGAVDTEAEVEAAELERDEARASKREGT